MNKLIFTFFLALVLAGIMNGQTPRVAGTTWSVEVYYLERTRPSYGKGLVSLSEITC